jgi:coenzyme F420 hydrogenase subunit alpha
LSKVVEISPTTRHEGHSKLVLKVNDAGIIETGNWCSITPVRGVERLAVGKSMEQVPKIASRVCGICPIAHTLAGIESMEASIGCEIPQDAYQTKVHEQHDGDEIENRALTKCGDDNENEHQDH